MWGEDPRRRGRPCVNRDSFSATRCCSVFVSHRAGAYGRLLLAMHECMLTGTLSACDWLMPVTRGAWRVAPPVDAGGGGGGVADVS